MRSADLCAVGWQNGVREEICAAAEDGVSRISRWRFRAESFILEPWD